MQKGFALLLLCFVLSVGVTAQTILGNTALARELYTKVKKHVAKRDYPNAILVYNQLTKMEPDNLVYRRELAHTYFLSRDFNRAIMVIKPLLRKKNADEETFLTASLIYNARGFGNQAFDAIEKGLRRYPNSGILYADYGKLYLDRKKYDKAHRAWEKGVKKDPHFHLNYYNLAKSYSKSKKPFWSILYGETFVNMERYSMRTEEIKKVVFDSYKQLIANNQMVSLGSSGDQKRFKRKKSKFENKANAIYMDLAPLVIGGVDIDNVVMLRTRFLLRWMQVENKEYPYELFNFTNTLLSDGQFEGYNMWLFGKAANEKEFIKWVKNNQTLYEEFENYYNKHRFVNKPNQYYK